MGYDLLHECLALVQQQDAFLQMAGQSLMNDDPSITCNIFGGEDACKTVSADSEFASNCQAYREDLKVDCAYYSSSEEHLDTHPGDALNKFLGASYNRVTQDCPQCLTSLQALVRTLLTGMFSAHLLQEVDVSMVEPDAILLSGLPCCPILKNTCAAESLHSTAILLHEYLF